MTNKSEKPSPDKEEQIRKMEDSIKVQEALQAAKSILPSADFFVVRGASIVSQYDIEALHGLLSGIEDARSLERTLQSVLLKCDTRYLRKDERLDILLLQEFVGDLAKAEHRLMMEE